MLDRRQGLKAAFALAGLAAAGGRAWAAPGPAVIALSEQRNRFLVDVAINDVDGFRFVLDTGASTHFISARLVEQLGLPQVERRMAGGYDGRRRESVVGLAKLVVGGVGLRRATAVVWPPERLEGHDGLIGYPFLFPDAVLNLAAAELSLGGAAPEALVPVRAKVTRHQTLLIGGLAGAQGRFAFDTGSQDCTVSPAYLRRIATTEAYRSAPKLVRRNARGETEIAAFSPEAITFGALRIADPILHVAVADLSGSVFDGVDGLFGVSLIRRYAWALDQAGGKLGAGPGIA
jgi:hypothetical protein